MTIDYVNIAKQLSLQAHDILLVASDVRNLAYHEASLGRRFDVNTFIQSFKEQLPSGTLLFHAFTDHLVSGDTFDYQKSKPNTGSLSVAAWKDPSFRRTPDPFHSFMVWGKDSATLKEWDDPSTFGGHSVFAWLHQHKAKMLIIDLPLVKSFTFVHYCEERLHVPYRKHIKHLIRYIDETGIETIRERFFFTRKSGYGNYLDDLEKRLIEAGIIQTFHCNDARFMLGDLTLAYDFIANNIYPLTDLKLYTFSLKAWVNDELRKILKSCKG
jgi:aminoglycoside N3'-acetyltransferase